MFIVKHSPDPCGRSGSLRRDSSTASSSTIIRVSQQRSLTVVRHVGTWRTGRFHVAGGNHIASSSTFALIKPRSRKREQKTSVILITKTCCYQENNRVGHPPVFWKRTGRTAPRNTRDPAPMKLVEVFKFFYKCVNKNFFQKWQIYYNMQR